MADKTETDRLIRGEPVVEIGGRLIAVEGPLSIQLDGKRVLGTLMRTPGDDNALVYGFLLTEGLVERSDQILGVTVCEEGHVPRNIALVRLAGEPVDPPERLYAARTSCGLCGAEIIEVLSEAIPPPPEGFTVEHAVVAALPDRMRQYQRSFVATGSTHAAGIFNAGGELLGFGEDVGRHNALDKAVGHALLRGCSLSATVAVLSGRISYEMVLKAGRASCRVIAAVSGVTSLALELAERLGVTLAGFVRGGRMTLYTGAERVTHVPPQ